MQRLGPVVQLLGLGSYIATCVAGGPVAGHFLDVWLGTKPWLTMIGLALGLLFGLYGGYRQLTTTLKDMERWNARQRRQAEQQQRKK